MENPSESGGSFDASGAFHGGSVYSDEEDTSSNTNHQRGLTRPEPSKSSSSQPRPSPHAKKEPPNITNGTSSSQDTGVGDRDSSNVVPLRQSQSASSLPTTDRRPPSLPHPITTSASFSGVNSNPSLSAVESKPQREQPLRKPTTSPLDQRSAFTNYVKPVEEPKPQKPSHEDEMEQRLLNDADVFVSRLMEEEDGEPIPSPSTQHNTPQSPPAPSPSTDIRWVYQDPQGEIQGNFTAVEMTEWHSMGYFKPSLLVRRTGDEVFLPISEMKKFWKPDKPFEVDYITLPPIKKNQPPVLQPSLPAAAPTPALDESLLLQYQLHQQLMHQRQQAIYARLSQSEQFNSLSPLEQRQVVAQQASLAGLESLQGGLMLPHLQQHTASASATVSPPTSSNVIAVLQMLAAQQQQQQQQQQLQQQRLGVGVGASSVPVVGLPPAAEAPLDPLQQIMSQMGLQSRPPAPATPQNTPEDQRSFDQFLNSFRQRQATAPQPPPQSVVMESVWGGPAAAPAFPGWSVPPGHPPATAPSQSLWADPIAKGIKTEADILEEQLRAEEKKKEELRKQEELLRIKQEEEEKERERLRRIKEEEEQERKRKEEEEKERERERKRIQEAEERKKKEAAAAKKAELEKIRKEEEKKKKEEEKRRKMEEQKKQKEEEKRKAEEERRRQEEENKRQEEMAKRQNEALKKMQEQQQAQAQAQAQSRAVKAATTPAPWTPPDATGPSLADIQKTERKQQQQLREQQEMLRAYQEKHQQQSQQQQLKSSKSGSGLNLKWAETPNPAPARVKSLAEIQAEEQERMAKQAEKERLERMAASKDVPVPATGSIWQSATQSLTWNSNSPTSSVWGPMPVNSVSGGGARFFDEERTKPAAKPQAQAQAKPQAKTKAKKEEATVMKLFEKQLSKTAKTEEFNKWCAKALHDANNVDIPTFIDFLWTVESQAEIQEYSQLYLDEPRRASQFAADFMLRRQRLLSNNPQDLRHEPVSLVPSPAQTANNFQEVKGKNKKLKKKNMTKVDSRILGFNVTAAPDRINVGDRDYGENI